MTDYSYTILFYSTSYLLFFALLWLSKKKKGIRLFDENGFASNPRLLIILHIGGIILFGMLPSLLNHVSSFELYNIVALENLSTWITVLVAIVFIIISPRIAEKKYREMVYNAPLNTALSNEFIIVYFFARISFICAYESWFRGYLLNDSVICFGAPLAIILNVSLYTLLHMANGKVEMVACIPFGLLLCILCIWQGAVWPSIIIHLALTIPYEISFTQKLKTYKAAI